MTTLDALVAGEFAALADALAPLGPDRWAAASLCAGWSVAHVVAHLTTAARYPADRFGAELAADGYDVTRTSDRLADADTALPPEALLADLRSATMAGFAQPGGGMAGSLAHVVIHGLDVTVPLGLGRVGADEAARTVLDQLVAPGDRTVFGVDLTGSALRATDLDWAHGRGEPVTAGAAELVLTLSGRSVGSALAR
ncbi:maleylpyruvate isomerase family mycothiol-dependent enzyme [Actinomycetospora straminea]|uniref:Maleylpyruvate isomerase family mycothiol-dependent enzyme n=1 Tax=Actinomycetospora straminea TaxID=663607 RepID=A0ABP9ERX3_9PSEU|nr:maleylpyruvate isomerase family mycothiol-dependent enzyme [Actinomycetospora straminea]MDD7931521.1 maleylpyruvate isomerase family mycothiol-dependent enzyme [Actinomycetospora straminea]